MPSTKNDTLQRIQQEIKECVQREEELRRGYAQLYNNNNVENGFENKPPPLLRTQSASVLNTETIITNGNSNGNTNGNSNGNSNGNTNGNSNGSLRRFAQNPTATKGVMQRFIKSRGKLSMSNLSPATSPQAWVPNDIFEPAKLPVEAGKRVRNGFVPVEERMKQELQDFSQREHELRNERRKSQPDLMALLELNAAIEESNVLRPAKSMAQLYVSEDLSEESCSAPSSLKQARSLADLCEAVDEELSTPGTHYLIMQFENLKKQKEQARA